jgi:hypothetical protein
MRVPTLTRPIGDSRWNGAVVAVFVAPVLAHQLLGPDDPGWLALAACSAIILVAFAVSPIRGLLLLAITALFVDTVELGAGSGVKLADEILLPLLAAWTVLTRWRTLLPLLHLGRELAAGAIVAAGVASSLVAEVPPTIWLPGLLLVSKGIVVFYLALGHEVRVADLRWAARLVLAIAAGTLVVGLVELVAPGAFAAIGLPPSGERAGLPAIKGPFYHPQLFGWFCGFVALYLFAGHVTMRRTWMLVLAVALSIGTVLSARRRAIVALVSGLGAGIAGEVVRGRDRLRVRLVRWLPSTVAVALVALAFLPAMSGLYQLTIERYVPPGITGEPGSEAYETPARVALYEGAVAIAGDHFPLGVGFGRYGSWVSRTEYSDVYYEYGLDRTYGLGPEYPAFITDSFWPEILGEAGVVGAAGYLAFLAVIGIQLLRISRRSDMSPLGAGLALGTLMIFGQTLVESLASAIFNSPSQVYLVMLAVGVAIGSGSARPGLFGRDAPAVTDP